MDFSTIALDESTERLLYLEVEEETKSSEEEAAPQEKGPEVDEGVSEEKPTMPGVDATAWNKKSTEKKAETKSKKASRTDKKKPEKQAEPEKKSVGIGLDFTDDFADDFADDFNIIDTSVNKNDASNAVDEIYAKGGM